MRVRNRKGATELLEANPQYVVLNPLEAKGKWRDLFGNDNPIHVEVGSGKGAFVTGMAKQNPDINYIGIDIQKSVLSYALDKVLEVGVPNIKLLWVDGSDLTDYFEDGEIDRLYLNFSDPWPKKRHEKRRLTYYGYKYNQTVLNKLYWYGQLSYLSQISKYYMNQDLENVNREIHGLRHFRDKYGKRR